jgi:4-hydroxybenzoate polyprenyltransferase
MSRQLWGYVRLVHPGPVLLVLVATGVLAALAVWPDLPLGRLVLTLAAMLGGQIAIGALNEWCDREADAAQQPDKPIPAGIAAPGGALRLMLAGTALMTVTGVALGWAALAVLLIGTGWGLAYDLWFKRTPLSWLPYLGALPLLPYWTWLAMGRSEPRLLWLYPLGALYVLAVHLAQSLKDVAGDAALQERGLAVTLGQRRSELVIWSAALASTACVAIGAAILSDQPLPAYLASGAAGLLLIGGVGWSLRQGFDDWLFKLLGACAIVLAVGWVLSAVE